MSNRPNRDAKTEAIYAAARKIIETEGAHCRAKTDRLKALRLAKEAESEEREENAPGDALQSLRKRNGQ
jgi:hypothetical protein